MVYLQTVIADVAAAVGRLPAWTAAAATANWTEAATLLTRESTGTSADEARGTVIMELLENAMAVASPMTCAGRLVA